VLHLGPNKKAIVKAERIPKIGETVVDEKNRRVGTVFDVFGPTVSPYVEVEVKVEDTQRVVDSIIYVSPSRRRNRSKKRK
jgi:rRNA processing protein Gar1